MRSVTLKSAMTPSFMGRMATMFRGVRPTISLASLHTASTSPLVLLIATMEGSFTTIPFPFGIDQRVGSAEIDREIGREQTKQRSNVHVEASRLRSSNLWHS